MPAATKAAVRLENVSKRFKKYRPIGPHTTLKTAFVEWFRHLRASRDRMTDPERFDVLRDVSLEIMPGETLGVIGRNGAGKSTLLKMIAGIYKPDRGRVLTNGRVAALIELGAGFHPDFTGRENVLINGIILGLTKREVKERFDRIVRFAEIGDFIEAPVRTYSSGMFMRLAFSVAIHVDPEILLIDEILAVGDEAFQRKCRGVIEERIASRRNMTVIVSHELDLITELCQRVLLVDPPHATLYDDPTEAVRRFRSMLAASPADAATS